MENENQNENQVVEQNEFPDYGQNPVQQNSQKKYLGKVIISVLILILMTVSAYFLYNNPDLFRADISELPGGGEPAGSDTLYIPSYQGGVGEEGNIAVKTRQNISEFDSFTFTLTYSPVDSLIFDKNPILFDTDTLFQSAVFNMTSETRPGSLVVTIILDDVVEVDSIDDPLDVSQHVTLFKLNTQISPLLSQGQIIQLGSDNLAVLNGASVLNVSDITAGTIEIASQDELRVLNAEVTDGTHIAVHFSDYIQDISIIDAYTINPALAVATVELGDDYGYDQKTVVLTTAQHTEGKRYMLTVSDTVIGNTEGAVNSDHESVIFYGYGQEDAVLSNFSMVSAVASDYHQIVLNFSDPVEAASVIRSDFVLENLTTSTLVTIDDVSVSESQVTLTVTDGLLKKYSYLLKAYSADSVSRQSDGAYLGIDRVSFTGYKNGPRILNASVLSEGEEDPTYSVQISFDEHIEEAGAFVGHLYETGALSGTLINATSEFSPVVSGQTITLTSDIFNSSDTNFTFSVSAVSNITNTLGVSTDEAYKTITFWGYGHDIHLNTTGSINIAGKTVIDINQGTLDFTSVEQDEVSVFHYSGPDTLVSHDISSVTFAGGVLKTVIDNSIDPDIHYILRISDGTMDDNTVSAKEFVLGRNLSLVDATAISLREVNAQFSKNIDEDGLDESNFSVEGMGIQAGSFDIQPDFRNVRFLTDADLTAGQIYQVTADDVRAYAGGDLIGKNTVAFAGYGSYASSSDIVLSSVSSASSNTVRIEFSGSVNPSTVTPVNIAIVKIESGIEQTLSIADIEQISSSVFELTTGKQTSGSNYFITFNGVKDSTGLLVGNSEVLNFIGFDLPEAVLNTITPGTITNDEAHDIIMSGVNLDIIASVRLGSNELNIVNQSALSLVVSVPAGLSQGNYDITLIDNEGEMKVFTNALLITSSTIPMHVISDESRAIPYNVPNDGMTVTKLWVLVEDPQGLSSISSVIVDLSQIGGAGTQEMIKDAGTQPLNKQWYTYETIIPATVATKSEPYVLPVEVRKGSDIANGTVDIMVTNDVYKSVAPVINNIYVSPLTVSPDGESPVKISAQISDIDGADTITSVVADLGALGAGFVPLSAMDGADSSYELTTRFYQSEEFIVANTTETNTYTINVTAMDATGESAVMSVDLIVSTELTGPEIQKAYISPRQSVPRDEKTTFSLHAYVGDPDTVADITTVTADFGNLGISPTELIRGVNSDDEAKNAWYSAEGFTVPKTAPVGVHQIEITATDKSGGIENSIIQIDVTNKDTLGDPPRIIEDRSYTTPRVGINDGETSMTLYAFVRDYDDDIDSVVVNLSQIGQVGAESSDFDVVGTQSSDSGLSSGDGLCPTGSNVIVCMNPSIKEGNEGQWFILPGITISKTTAPSSEAYNIEVIATDSGGKITRGFIPVYVNDGEAFTNDKNPPEIVTAVAVSSTKVEILFNEEISASTVSSDGREFKITNQDDISQILDITNATINAIGTVVTLTTMDQVKNKTYVVSATNDIRDAVGVSLVAGAKNRAFFNGFESKGRNPVVEYVTSTDIDTVEIEFRDSLKPSSLGQGKNFNFQIFEAGTGKKLDVLSAGFSASANVIQLTTDPQKGGERYRVQIKGVSSYDGTTPDVGLSTTFKGYNMRTVQRRAAANMADLNGDGHVDFTDFTIFSSVYGTSYINALDDIDSNHEPIEDNPDSLVPHTSETVE